MDVKGIIIIVLLSVFLFGCDSGKNQHHHGLADQVDTLYFHENIYKDKKGFGLPHKSFKYKSKTAIGLPRNEEIIMTLSYEGDYKKLIKHTTTEIYSDSKELEIKKIDDFHFKLFIDSLYADSTITMTYYLIPKKNYVMKVYFQDEVVKYPEKTIGARFIQIVNQK